MSIFVGKSLFTYIHKECGKGEKKGKIPNIDALLRHTSHRILIIGTYFLIAEITCSKIDRENNVKNEKRS